MTRSWTDPRTGRRWHIDAVRALARARNRRKADGERGASALLFASPEAAYALPTEDASRLEALDDERLVELLDAARLRAEEPSPPEEETAPPAG
jgi:hypothetical protein